MAYADPGKIINNGTTNADVYSKPVHCGARFNVRLQVYGDPGSTPVGDFKVLISDDPRAKADIEKGIYGRATGATAKWVQVTLPEGSVHIDAECASVTFASPDDVVHWDGTDAAEFVINVDSPGFFVCLWWDRSSGGAATGLDVWSGARE